MPNANKIKRTAKRNRLKIFFVILISSPLFFQLLKSRDQKIEIPTLNEPPSIHANSPSPKPTKVPETNIQRLLNSEIQKLPGTYHVVVKDLKSTQTYTTSADKNIPTASIYKLAVMYKTYDAIEKGELKKDQTLSGDLTVEKALGLMITISDNTSALLLAEKLGWSNINNFLITNGINGFNLMIKDYPTTTALAVSDLLEKIYKKEAVSPSASEEMLKLMLAQTRNDRIPLNLPTNINVAHKTGELDNFRHDAGIVYGLKSDYIFVFLTETPVPEESYGNIAKLTKTMFEALEKD